MSQPSNEILELAIQLRERLAGSNLPPSFARLYSQHTRLRAGQSELPSWQEEESLDRLEDAVYLLEAAFIEREAGGDRWQEGLRRAGELLEWLSHPQLNPGNLPIGLLAAATYQLAGYPARSMGLLNENTMEVIESNIFRSLLKADFPNLLRQLAAYWSGTVLPIEETRAEFPWDDPDALAEKLQQRIFNEIASALGVLCATMRWWSEDPRMEKALNKLSAVGKVLLHGHDSYSWLLAKLCAEVASVYVVSSMWKHLEHLYEGMSLLGKEAFRRYLRQSYQSNTLLAWPSQVRGIESLNSVESFALCTPTGSGKTRVAELAILQSLFREPSQSNESSAETDTSGSLVIYLVPSRALAAEVESKLSRVLSRLHEPVIIVTSLYGGSDLGPTDLWFTSEKRSVLICTYEKAEALLRFLSPRFLRRVSLVVIDEAHLVQFDGKREDLQKSENRALRLESLGTRLLTYLNQNQCRVIALSAVATGIENAIASWVTGNGNATPAKTSYRSTRQLIGRLECLPNRRYAIYCDLLDGADLHFEKSSQLGTPYIPDPFSLCPSAAKWEDKKANQGPEKSLRPNLFWAAMQLASFDNRGQQRAVLISVTQHIDSYAKDFLEILDKNWKEVQKPEFFRSPEDPEKKRIWDECLRSCEDYFTTKSSEYELLRRGIVVHHGKMPGLMARILVKVIQERIVHLVLATSTLSEGVNLPFETILIPNLRRSDGILSVREFGNLVGRAGRPGFGTEGRSLVLLASEPVSRKQNYFDLVKGLEEENARDNQKPSPRSPLAELIVTLENQWRHLSDSEDQEHFFNWLEQTAPLNVQSDPAIETLDSLDEVILSAMVEIEQIAGEELSADNLEEQLRQIWQRSYAYYASQEETRLANIFIRRGRALKMQIYPTSPQRKRLYRTGLPPRSGNQLLELYPKIRLHLETGRQYAKWDIFDRFEYIKTTVDLIGTLPRFKFDDKLVWLEVLQWWLNPSPFWSFKRPSPERVSTWHEYVSKNFGYRFNWGLGSVVALAIHEAYDGEIRELTLEDWPQIGLPWIVFWMKELIVWGTLEPVGAYLLARGLEVTRVEAEKVAELYYNSEHFQNQEPNDLLNPAAIRNWVEARPRQEQSSPTMRLPSRIKVKLLREEDFRNVNSQEWRVVPVEVDNLIRWFDPAGFPLADCQKPEGWEPGYIGAFRK